MAQARLRDVQLLCGSGVVLKLSQFQKIAKVVQVHALPLGLGILALFMHKIYDFSQKYSLELMNN